MAISRSPPPELVFTRTMFKFIFNIILMACVGVAGATTSASNPDTDAKANGNVSPEEDEQRQRHSDE